MRLSLIAAIIMALIVPFAFADTGYLLGEYREWLLKLEGIASAPPNAWVYQADFASMLDSFGLDLPPAMATAIRLLAALATLMLARRVYKINHQAAFAMAVLLLSGCYLCEFGPRNEYLSFLVLTPGLTALSFLLFADRVEDWRGWTLIVVVLVLGWHWSLQIDRFIKPALVCGIYVWLGRLMIVPQQWCEIVDRGRQRGGGYASRIPS
jgi:hypothetical protein